MSRYIDADALYKALEKIYCYEMDLVEMRDSSILITFRTICRQIDSIPTADVVSKEKYDELNEKYHRLLESAKILSDAVSEYERREDEHKDLC